MTSTISVFFIRDTHYLYLYITHTNLVCSSLRCSRQDGQLCILTEDQCKYAVPSDLFSWKKSNITIQTSIYSLCWPLTLLHHVPNRLLAGLNHVSSISAGFQQSPTTHARRDRPCLSFPLPLPCSPFQTGSKKFWIQAATNPDVRHRKVPPGPRLNK